MIRISFDLVSTRGPRYNRSLGVMEITNDGTGTRERGNYEVTISRPGGRVRHTTVTRFARLSRSVFELARRALNNINNGKDLP